MYWGLWSFGTYKFQIILKIDFWQMHRPNSKNISVDDSLQVGFFITFLYYRMENYEECLFDPETRTKLVNTINSIKKNAMI